MITQADLDNWFSYHPPDPERGDIGAYLAIRDAGRHLAETILHHTPGCPDQTAAIRKVREAVMTANAARACGPKSPVTSDRSC